MASEFWLTDAQFERLRPLLPNKPRGVPRVDDRRVISGIVHVLISGGRWIDAPTVYGPRKTLYNRWVRWAKAGVWVRAFEALAASGGPPAELMLETPPGPRRTARRRAEKGGFGQWHRSLARRADHQAARLG